MGKRLSVRCGPAVGSTGSTGSQYRRMNLQLLAERRGKYVNIIIEG